MMGNTNEPSTRVRVSNIGVSGTGGCVVHRVVCFGKQVVLYVHIPFPLESSYIKMCFKNKDIVDLIEITVFLLYQAA